MKTYKTFLTEADTSEATKTEMAIVYAYNKINPVNNFSLLVSIIT